MELSNYWVFKTRSGLFVNRTARELLFEVNQTTLTNLKQLLAKTLFFTFQGSRDPLLDVGSMFAKKGGIPMDKY